MALINRATQIAASLPKVFKALREGTAPEKFNQQHLIDLGFGNSNYRILIPLLKDLGFPTKCAKTSSTWRWNGPN
jgi:hypothetical protein